MRLTLRTLLAYLDSTLDPQDAEALRSKLGESGFATQLVQRIRNTLNNGTLSAPSPEAVGPVEEANVISEYLDSTLPTEQVAEIERACLESDPHLAEAAACHQILTMVLGKPAEVSPELRDRIYELPDRSLEDIAAGGSFSAVAIPEQQPLQSLSNELPTADLTSSSQPVRPVGVADSGVSDAPTRLREAAATGEGKHAGAVLAGSKQRSIDDTKIYGGSIRPSRITPWLVSLALAGVLLFVLSQIFQPLFNQQTASVDPIQEIEVSADEAPIMVDIGSPEGAVDPSGGEDAADSSEAADTLPAPEALPSPAATTTEDSESDDQPVSVEMAEKRDEPSTAEAPDGSGESAFGGDAAAEPVPTNAAPPTPSVETVAAEAMPEPTGSEPSESQPGQSDKSAMPAAGDAEATDSPPPPPASAVASDAEKPEPPAVEPVAEVNKEIAKIYSSKTMLAGRVGTQWVRLVKDMVVGEGLKINCAPTFRGQMGTDDVKVTMVGPTQVEWFVGEAGEATLQVEYGQVLVSAVKAGKLLKVRLGDQETEIGFADIDSVAAMSVKHFRAPGTDPLKVDSRKPLARVISVQGSLTFNADGQETLLQTGQQWVKRASNEAQVVPVEEVPSWIDPPDETTTSLESGARDGLLEMVKGDQPLEIALREARLFRRSEVAALAGRTLLNLGFGDVYFGSDGMLSEPKQRAYWPDHFVALVSAVDRSAESATQMRESIVKMDSANAKPLFRLLTGYSQKQLVEGGDQELVELLDSSSMAVRVMALESLHGITGTTLYFRAEQENAVRRQPGIKKWIARQRKGDIRWQE